MAKSCWPRREPLLAPVGAKQGIVLSPFAFLTYTGGMHDQENSIAPPLTTLPETLPQATDGETWSLTVQTEQPIAPSSGAAEVLVKHLFAQPDTEIPGISYAVAYKLADGGAGGDIIDVYHFDNDSVAFSIADIAGKGTQAAIHAALIKYGLRAYASHGLNPEKVLRSLDRLYLENNNFEGTTESFASVFFGLIDPTRRLMTYSCAAHEPVIVIRPDGTVCALDPTAPLIGVFEDQHHLFKQSFIELPPGTLFVAATDGVTEARSESGELFGMKRFIECVHNARASDEVTIVQTLMGEVEAFCSSRRRDDIAVIVATIH